MSALSYSSLASKVVHNHKRTAAKHPGEVSPPSGGPVTAVLLGGKVAFVSPSANGAAPVVYVAPISYRMLQASAAEIAALNGRVAEFKIAPPPRPDLKQAIGVVLDALAKAETVLPIAAQ
jgi:hypothetical protein